MKASERMVVVIESTPEELFDLFLSLPCELKDKYGERFRSAILEEGRFDFVFDPVEWQELVMYGKMKLHED